MQRGASIIHTLVGSLAALVVLAVVWVLHAHSTDFNKLFFAAPENVRQSVLGQTRIKVAVEAAVCRCGLRKPLVYCAESGGSVRAGGDLPGGILGGVRAGSG